MGGNQWLLEQQETTKNLTVNLHKWGQKESFAFLSDKKKTLFVLAL